jgi:hypothetical protein
MALLAALVAMHVLAVPRSHVALVQVAMALLRGFGAGVLVLVIAYLCGIAALVAPRHSTLTLTHSTWALESELRGLRVCGCVPGVARRAAGPLDSSCGCRVRTSHLWWHQLVVFRFLCEYAFGIQTEGCCYLLYMRCECACAHIARAWGLRCGPRCFSSRDGSHTLRESVCAQVTSHTHVNGEVTTTLWWEAAGVRTALSAADYRGLSLREKAFAMREVNLFVARVADGGEGGDGGGGDDDAGAPLLARR